MTEAGVQLWRLGLMFEVAGHAAGTWSFVVLWKQTLLHARPSTQNCDIFPYISKSKKVRSDPWNQAITSCVSASSLNIYQNYVEIPSGNGPLISSLVIYLDNLYWYIPSPLI